MQTCEKDLNTGFGPNFIYLDLLKYAAEECEFGQSIEEFMAAMSPMWGPPSNAHLTGSLAYSDATFCREVGHDWKDYSTAGPDSGNLYVICDRCGESHYQTLY